MTASSLHKLGIVGVSAALLVSGLTASVLASQAATEGADAPLQLLQSPAAGTLSSLGGVSGYVTSQAKGDLNGWLTGQGVDPAAAGPITDTTLPSQAQGAITVNNGTVSLASGATGVNVGYLVGEATGTENLTLSMANLAPTTVPTSDEDPIAYALTWEDMRSWLNGTEWNGHYNYNGASFDFTVTWSPTQATVTAGPSNASPDIVNYLTSGIANGLNSPTDETPPGGIFLTSLIATHWSDSWSDTSPLPYSFAYAVNGALTPGGSVTVNPQDVVANSSLKDFTFSGAQASGPLTDIPLTDLFPESVLTSWPSLSAFSDYLGAENVSEVATMLITSVLNSGQLDSWISDYFVDQVNDMMAGMASGAAITLQPLSSDTLAKIQSNTPDAVARLVEGGFPQWLASNVSADITVDSALDPGTVTSLTPTGVTYTAPAEPTPSESTTTPSPSPTETTTTPSTSPTQTTIVPPTSATQSPTQTPTQTTVAPSTSPTQTTVVPPTGTPTPTQSVTVVPPTGTPTPTQSVTVVPPTGTPTPTQSQTVVPPTGTPTPTQSETVVPPTGTPTPTQSETVVPPTGTPTQSPTEASTVPPSPRAVNGSLEVSPLRVTNGSTVAIASVVNDAGEPVPGIDVTFDINGNAQFSNGSTQVVSTTDDNGQASALITTSITACINPGFDVSASMSTQSGSLQLAGSPTHASVAPMTVECGNLPPTVVVLVANGTQISGTAGPGEQVNVVTDSGAPLGDAVTDGNRNWVIQTPVGTPSQFITIGSVDSSGDIVAQIRQWLDTDRPAAPRIDRSNTTEVSGNVGAVEAFATVTVTFPDGTTAMTQANEDGSYRVATPANMTLGTATVTQTDAAGNVSDPSTANLVKASTLTATLRYTQVQAGNLQTVTGTGFRYGERVTASLCNAAGSCSTVGSATASILGRVSITFTVPKATVGGAYTVTLSGPTSGSVSSVAFAVTVPATSASNCCWWSAYVCWWLKWGWLFR